MSISSKAIQAILDEGHPVLVLLPKTGKKKDVLDEVLRRISVPRDGEATAKVNKVKAKRAAGKRKAWTKNEVLGLAVLSEIGGRGSVAKFAKKTGRSYLSVRSKVSALSHPKDRPTTGIDDEVLKLAKTRPSEYRRLGKRALSILGVSV